MAKPQVPRIAVLPFSNPTGGPDEDYFCEGFAVEILISLTRTSELQVVARSSVQAIKGIEFSVAEIGKKLNATAVLKGSVSRLDDRITISAELVDVVTGTILWSARFDRALAEVFEVQDAIATGVAGALLEGREPGGARMIQSIQTHLTEAYEYYLRGRQSYYLYSRHGVEAARELFERAIEIDPGYALAYCGLADCCSYLYLYVESTDVYLEPADSASRRALELDPDLAEASASRGEVLSLSGRFDEAEAAFLRAIELDPRLFEGHYLYARACSANGQPEKAARLYLAANSVRSEDFQSLLLAAQITEALGDKPGAEALRRRGLSIAQHHLTLNPNDARALYMGANGYVGLGEAEKGLEWLRRAMEIDPDDAMLLYNAGCVFSLVGKVEEALSCLERAVELGLREKGWFDHDSDLDAIRRHPRFVALQELLV